MNKNKYELKYYVWAKEVKEYYLDEEEAMLEAYQHARNSAVYIDGIQVYANYHY